MAIMCGYLNLETCRKRCIVIGIKSRTLVLDALEKGV
jgi:uncharacterized protein YunC (DUF1805 family)